MYSSHIFTITSLVALGLLVATIVMQVMEMQTYKMF